MDQIVVYNPSQWSQHREALMRIERSCFLEGVQETAREKRRILSVDGSIVLLYKSNGLLLVSAMECLLKDLEGAFLI